MAGETLPIDAVGATAGGQGLEALILVMAAMIFVAILVGVALYIYTAMAWMRIAKKTNTEPAWLAWIPIANIVLISRVARMHWWPILLLIPGMIFSIFNTIYPETVVFLILYVVSVLLYGVFHAIWMWKTFERVGRPGWWAIITFAFAALSTPFLAMEIPGLTMLLGIILAVIGTALSLVFLGFAAWGNKGITKAKKSRK